MNITTQESQEDSKSQSQVYNKIRKITSHHKHNIFLNHIRKCVKSQSKFLGLSQGEAAAPPPVSCTYATIDREEATIHKEDVARVYNML